MATYQIFEHEIGSKTFAVWITDGLPQYVINGEIQHDIASISDFLIEAAKTINSGDDSNPGNLSYSGANISNNGLENFQSGAVAFDSGGTNPSITLNDGDTAVKIGGSGVGGTFKVDFGTGADAVSEAASFKEFADDLLGKATATEIDELTGVQIGDFLRTVTVSTRDDDVEKISFKSTGDSRDLSWADSYIEFLAGENGGTQAKNGNVSENNYTANQLHIEVDGTTVDLGSNGVGGKETYSFDNSGDAQNFFDEVKAAYTGDRREIINDAIESIATELGGAQIKNGNVSTSYAAKQIKLTGSDKSIVDLGSHGVGGKETYDFDDQATAQKFIDSVRDALGLEGQTGKLVGEHIYKVSGGAGISGSPTFVGKDAFVQFIASEFGGTQSKNGAVGEGFSGGGKKIGDGSSVQLGPSGVGGKEVWEFDSEETADAFLATLDDVFA